VGEIRVKVIPRSSRNALEVHESALRAWITAAPTDGQANEALCELIAAKLKIAKSRVSIVRGQTSRQKTVSVHGIDTETLLSALDQP
jgi:uncharacterized protein